MNIKDIYNVESALKKLANSSMLPYNKAKIREYFDEKVAQGVKRTSYPYVLRILIRLGIALQDKKFEEVSKSEMVSFFTNLKPENRILKTKNGAVIEIPIETYSENTLWQLKAAVKTFYRWLLAKDTDEPAPEAVRWIKHKGHNNGMPWDKFKKEILTGDEASGMLKAAKNARDKALIAVLWEYGLRASELLDMKKSDLKIHENYIEFEVDGKTGKREVIIVESKPFLEAWLAELEERKNQIPKNLQDHIWLAFVRGGLGPHKKIGTKILSRDLLNIHLKYIAKRANITKRVWTHGFRHSAATRDTVTGYNEVKLRAKYGWSKQSSMPSVYVHFSNQNLKKEILIEKGIWKPDKKEDEPLTSQIIKCPFCSVQNVKDSEYCNKCGKPLHIEQLKAIEKKAKHMSILQEMIQQELEKKGFDLEEMARILATKIK